MPPTITDMILHALARYIMFCLIMGFVYDVGIVVNGAQAVGTTTVRSAHDTPQHNTSPHVDGHTVPTVTKVPAASSATAPGSGGIYEATCITIRGCLVLLLTWAERCAGRPPTHGTRTFALARPRAGTPQMHRIATTTATTITTTTAHSRRLPVPPEHRVRLTNSFPEGGNRPPRRTAPPRLHAPALVSCVGCPATPPIGAARARSRLPSSGEHHVLVDERHGG